MVRSISWKASIRPGKQDYALEPSDRNSRQELVEHDRAGSTITLEAWDLKYKPNSDWNHAWGAAPANIIPGYLWGIGPVRPGLCKSRDQASDWATDLQQISVPTIRGNIKAEFRNQREFKGIYDYYSRQIWNVILILVM